MQPFLFFFFSSSRIDDQLRMLQEMGLDREACTEYLTAGAAATASGIENDAFRVTPNYLNLHVQSSE